VADPGPQQHIRTMTSARLAADVADVPTVVIARTDAEAATLITSDVDERDQPFITGERTKEGFYRVKNGMEPCIARAKAYAPYSDLIWMETGKPDLELAKQFAEGVKAEFPGPDAVVQLLAVVQLAQAPRRRDDREVPEGAGVDGLQVPVHHAGRLPRPQTTRCSIWPYGYARNQMTAYVELQEREFAAEERGYTATKHQREVGAGYFDRIATTVDPTSSTTALTGFDRRGSVPLSRRVDTSGPAQKPWAGLDAVRGHVVRRFNRTE